MRTLLMFILCACSGLLAASEAKFLRYHPPATCEVTPETTTPDWQCIQREEQACYGQHCNGISDTGEWSCNWSFLEACLIDAPRRCPDIVTPAEVDFTECGRCIPKSSSEVSCTHETGVSVVLGCDADFNVTQGLGEGWNCGACERVRPPGTYQACSCGDQEWMEICEPTNAIPEPVSQCELTPEFCISAERPD